MIQIKTKHIIGFVLAAATILIDFLVLYDFNQGIFRSVIAVALFFIAFPFWMDVLKEARRQREIEEKFLEFTRSLEETVRSGIPIPKAIQEISRANYGALTPYVVKLARNVEWGIPMRDALLVFSKSTKNKLIKRSMAIVIEAEERGGNIQDVLSSVTSSVLQIKKIKEERRANTFSQMIQGYIVFFIFVGIMIVLEVYLLPQLSNITGTAIAGLGGGIGGLIEGGGVATPATVDFGIIFTSLILVQGFFAGLLIGKFAEGNFKVGLKHSLILILAGYLTFTTITGF